MGTASTLLAVIIPYFQTEGGILRRALHSVWAQALPAEAILEVIVVDDGSPAPVAPEVGGLQSTDAVRLRVISTPNQGVSAARNVGLAAVAPDTDYIAFLDSDDAWDSDHVAWGLAQRARGFDLYFTDHRRSGRHASHFAATGFPPVASPPGAMQQIDETTWSIDPAFFFSRTLSSLAPHLSTIIYRRLACADLRFSTELLRSGEDRLFILGVIARSKTVLFRTQTAVTCGSGVNIYYSTFDWNDESLIRRVMSDILADYGLLEAFALRGRDRQAVARRIRHNRAQFAFFTARWFLKGRGPWSDELRALARRDRAFWRWYPRALLAAPFRRAGSSSA